MKSNPLRISGLIVTFLLFSLKGFSQQTDSTKISKNAIYIELLGPSLYWYNLSYDRIIASIDKHKLSISLGIQFPAMSKMVEEYSKKSVAPQLNYLFGRNENFETGVGILYDLDTKERITFLRIGLRAQIKNDLFLKIAFTPFIRQGAIFPWFFPSGGLALGWAF